MEFDAFVKLLLEKAKAAGLAQCEAFYQTGEEFEVLVHDGEILQYNVSQSLGLGFRALVNGRMGCASTQALDEEAADFLIAGAIENASLIENEDRQFLAPAGGTYREMDGYREAVASQDAQAKIDLARALEKTGCAMDARVKPEYSYVFSSVGAKRIVNSLGLDETYRDSAFGVGLDVQAREGDKVSSGGKTVYSRDPASVSIEEVARAAVREAVDGLSGAPVPTGSYPVLLRNDVAALFLSCFSPVFSADMAQKGMSLLAGREGDVIASEKVTLVDDPFHIDAFGSTPFDGEGSPTQYKKVVENGRLTTLLHNLKTAAKQGVATTGNASRGSYAATVGVAPTNFYLCPGEGALEDVAARLGEGLLITDVTGLHSGANQVSGDFSLGARGYRVRGGKICESVREITVAGNFYALLKDVEDVGGDLYLLPSGVGSPTIRVSVLSVAGM